MNLYVYVGNNPVNFVDPSGMVAKQVGNIYNEILENKDKIQFSIGTSLVAGGTVVTTTTLPTCISSTTITTTCVGINGGLALASGGLTTPSLSLCIPSGITAGASCSTAAAGIGTTAIGSYMIASTNSSSSSNGGGGGKGNTGGTSKTVTNVEVKGGKARVDIEYPTGGSSLNVHIQFKGKGGNYKEYLNSIDDLSKLPKDIRNNKEIINGVNKAFRNLENAQKTMK